MVTTFTKEQLDNALARFARASGERIFSGEGRNFF
jgi:hypothetical protein